jgi:HD-GYP domain-containing protein (c-di-GMP phosphodiesterase class II)
MRLKIKRFPFHVGIATLVVGIVVCLTALFLWVSLRESETAAIRTADRLFAEINEKVMGRHERTLESVAVLAGTAARMPGIAAAPGSDGAAHPAADLMFRALTFYESIFSLYIGYDDGGFIQIVAVRDRSELRELFKAPAGTFFVLRTIVADGLGGRRQHWRFLGRDRQAIAEMDDLDPGYDPRTRPWYERALREQTIFFTDPYVFSSTKLPGITCAKRLQGGGGVFGADITLDEFSAALQTQAVSEHGWMFLFDRKGRIIAHPGGSTTRHAGGEALDFMDGGESPDPLVRAIVADYATDPANMRDRTREMTVGGVRYLVRATAIREELKIDQVVATIAPMSDFTAHIRRMQERVFLFSGLALLAILPLALFVARTISGSLVRLEEESKRIQGSDFSETEPFDSSIKEIHSLIDAFVLMKRTIRDYTARLIQAKKEIEALFTAITELLAGAIDAKSPYTGGHCKRVPVLARLLADAAHESSAAPFAAFRMDSVEKRREFEVAAWLHDCGKITTPEYVVDKATKLETIYNRIHEVRMRFEVLLRDAELEFFRRLLEGGADEAALRAELERRRAEIADDFAFVARCNIGGEFMADEDIERLQRIAGRTWVRHLDDRLGISLDEAILKSGPEAPELPAVERVLADKPEHVVPRAGADPYDGNAHGFTMAVPANRRNLGELHNLSIRRGTLSAEDRFTINEHIVQTILMLKRLPFPEGMKDVPEIAGSHHETMTGTGYPRGLRREDMTVPARIMAIADIFEALTARDRPYKKPKTLGESLRIMSRMRDEGHIDADLFDLFLTSGACLDYARQYLDPAQLDLTDLGAFLSPETAGEGRRAG